MPQPPKRKSKKRGSSDKKAKPTGDRLQKVLAAAGHGSRRACEELIIAGRVDVDGKTADVLGTRVDPAKQVIRVDGVALPKKKFRCYLLNKPTGVVCTNHDPSGRTRVIDLVPADQRLFTVGRLDMSSEGLILVTNDGDLANELAHPRYGVEKLYEVEVAGKPEPEQLRQLRAGIHLAEAFVKVEAVKVKRRRPNSTVLEITLREGRNREIRRILARLGHKVLKLRRVAMGQFKLAKIPSGAYRELSIADVETLRKKKPARKPVHARQSSASDSTTSAQDTKKKTVPKKSATKKATLRKSKSQQSSGKRSEFKTGAETAEYEEDYLQKVSGEDVETGEKETTRETLTNPLHAQHYADRAVQATAEVIENLEVARDTFRLRFACPEMARRILPGQFLMTRVAGCDDPLIGRPLAMYDVIADKHGDPHAIDVVYIVKGKFTTRAATLQKGQEVDVWGPLGNGFPPCPAAVGTASHLIMVAGGIGYTPFLAVAKEVLGRETYGDPQRDFPQAKKVTFCYGARTADYLVGVEQFENAGTEVRISTDDGTRGHHGLVTDLLTQALEESSSNCRIVCCGPEPMMEAVAPIAAPRSVPCQVSLETPMACGIGICFSCVAKVTDDDGEWDYKRTCVEGPVFDAAKIVW